MKTKKRLGKLFAWIFVTLVSIAVLFFSISTANTVYLDVPMIGAIEKKFLVLIPDNYVLLLGVDTTSPQYDRKSIPQSVLNPPPPIALTKFSIRAHNQLVATEGAVGVQAVMNMCMPNTPASDNYISIDHTTLGIGLYTLSAEALPWISNNQIGIPHLILRTRFTRDSFAQRTPPNFFTRAQAVIVPIILVMMAIYFLKRTSWIQF